jgi:signal transduction histidine kinase
VALTPTQDALRLTISDDGVGFNVDDVSRSGLGLISMRERVEAVGGTLNIRSRPGEGTELEVTVPLQQLKAAV